jgi:N-acetylglucosaminyldiphosphoundecaprenol N-acetyl-beta-D-mannosaminyltransferase
LDLALPTVPVASADRSCIVHSDDGRQLDLGRDVHALLGLPFDALGVRDTIALLRRRAALRERCFMSTPNLNFAMDARDDAAFRQSILASDLCVADGMPIVWVARALGAPIAGRAAGSAVFEGLRAAPADPAEPPLKVYFFGGPPGAAQAAAAALPAGAGGLVGVGYDVAGFGSVEEMSTQAQIERINASGADFVVVALGARKGQAWIEQNRARIDAPLISHLGAVVNFVAGTVRRAPRWMRRTGLEWLWRVSQEPALWRRYARDGVAFAAHVGRDLLPWVLQRRRALRLAELGPGPSYSVEHGPPCSVFRLQGHWAGGHLQSLRQDLSHELRAGRTVQIDLTGVTSIGSALAGTLLLLEGWQRHPPVVPGSARAPNIRRELRAMGCSALFA